MMKINADNDQLLVEFRNQLSGSICVKIVEMNNFDQLRPAAADATLGKMWWSLLLKVIPDNDYFLLLESCFPLSGAICARIPENRLR